MPGPTATAGVVGVPRLSATDSTTATAVAERRSGLVAHFKTPLKSPLIQGGTPFLSNVAPLGGMKNSTGKTSIDKEPKEPIRGLRRCS